MRTQPAHSSLVTRLESCCTGRMFSRSRHRAPADSVVPHVSGLLGVSTAQTDVTMSGRLKTAFRRLGEQRRLRRIETLESKIAAKENLRDFRRSSGDEGGGAGMIGL